MEAEISITRTSDKLIGDVGLSAQIGAGWSNIHSKSDWCEMKEVAKARILFETDFKKMDGQTPRLTPAHHVARR